MLSIVELVLSVRLGAIACTAAYQQTSSPRRPPVCIGLSPDGNGGAGGEDDNDDEDGSGDGDDGEDHLHDDDGDDYDEMTMQ